MKSNENDSFSESVDQPSGPISAGDEPHLAGEIGPPADPVVQLQAELASAKSDAEQWRDRFLRKAAEFENFRKRTAKEKGEVVASAKSSVLAEMLPVVDGFERALASLAGVQDADERLRQYRQGIDLLYRQLLDTLQRLGVVAIEASGKPFDPHLHEALSRLETDEHEENTVVAELRKGYLFQERLLRPAQVAVSVRPRAENKSES